MLKIRYTIIYALKMYSTLIIAFFYLVALLLFIAIATTIISFFFLIFKNQSAKQDRYFFQVTTDLEKLYKQKKLSNKVFTDLKKYFKSATKDNTNPQTSIIKKQLIVKKSHSGDYGSLMLLGLGSFLIIFSALLLITFNWQQFNPIIKSLILPVFSLGFLLAGILASRYRSVKPAAATFLIVSEILLPLSFLGIWNTLLLGNSLFNFGIYWTIVSMFFISISFLYHQLIKNYFSKVVMVFGLYNLLFAIVLIFDQSLLARACYVLVLNLGAILFFTHINDKAIKRLLILISIFVNFVVYLYVTLNLLINNALLNLVDSSLRSSELFLSLIVMILPSIYLLISYIRFKRRIILAVALTSIFVQIPLFSFIWKIESGLTFLVLSIFSLSLIILQSYFAAQKVYLLEKLVHLFANLTQAVTIFALLTYDLSANIAPQFFNINILFAILVLWLKYNLHKKAEYLTFLSLLTAYPLIKNVFGYTFTDQLNSAGILLIAYSLILLIISISAQKLKAIKSARGLMPAFFALNIAGFYHLAIYCNDTLIMGFALLANVPIYLALSLTIFKGRHTFLASVFFITALNVLAKGIGLYGFATMYLFIGLAMLFIKWLIRNNLKQIKKVNSQEIGNWVASVAYSAKISGYFALTVSFYLSLLELQFGTLMIAMFISILFAILAYFSQQQKFLKVGLFLLLFIVGKVVNALNLLAYWHEGILLFLALGSMVMYIAHDEYEKHKLKGYVDFKLVYKAFSLFFSLLATFIALFNLRQIYGSFIIQIVQLLLAASIIFVWGLKTNKLGYFILSLTIGVLTFWKIGIASSFDNLQYYLISFGIFLHIVDQILHKASKQIEQSHVLKIIAIMAIMGASLIQSITLNTWYLLLLIAEGSLYALLYSNDDERPLAELAFVLVVIGVLFKIFTLVVSFPQWIGIGLTGLLILVLAIGVMIINQQEKQGHK